MRKKRRKKKVLYSAVFLLFFMLSFISVILLSSYLLGPPSLDSVQNTIFYSADKDVIGEERGSENRYIIPLEEMSEHVIDATVWTEDQHFYSHVGFDFKRLVGAIFENVRTMSFKEGASTITQQYARNLFLSHEKTWKRKIYEAFYTIRLEMFYDKDQLLEGYLNTIYYGHGAYGIEAASRYYFDKSAQDLTLAEASMLAGIPNGPSLFSPITNPENANRRHQQILRNLVEKEVISHADYIEARDTELTFNEEGLKKEAVIGPYFQDTALDELETILDLDVESIKSGGYRIFTTLKVDQQEKLEQAVKENLAATDKELQVGAVAMNPSTGAVNALIGGRDYQNSSFNRVTQSKRMPGSSFKPFLYYTALEQGMTAATTLMSKPTRFALAEGDVYEPSNYQGYYAEKPITLAQAIALSDNIYAVKTNLFVTPEKLVQTAKDKFGITEKLSPVASLALGTEVVTMEEMVNGYNRIANGGYAVEPYTITKVTDATGEVIYDRDKVLDKENQSLSSFFQTGLFSEEKKRTIFEPILPKTMATEDTEVERVLDPANTFILKKLMSGMFNEELNGYMSVTGSSIANELTREYAGKSGTTDTDSWMIGFSSDVSTGVWLGYDDNREMKEPSQQKLSKDIWATFMENAHENFADREEEAPPEDVVAVEIDLESGKLATDYCEQPKTLYFKKGTEPNSYCTLHLPDGDNPEQNETGEADVLDELEGLKNQISKEKNHLEPTTDFFKRWWKWLWIGEE